jgi:hypothetical protein
MAEQQDVIAELTAAGVLAGIRWAYASATTRSMEIYSEADGHDSAWLGHTRFTLFRDRLDRVFGCERYAVPTADGRLDVDVLCAELSERDLATMPRLAPGRVLRHDLRGSAGWSYRHHWFLISSAEFGRLETLPWQDKSLTKQLVAMQPSPDLRQPSLFEDLTEGLLADHELRVPTFIVAHTLDAGTGQTELTFGRPKFNLRGGPAWHWREDLMKVPLPVVRPAEIPAAAEIDDPAAVPDAPVRLRVIRGDLAQGRGRDDR